jgi:ABC-2 type transport system permease protein
LSFNKSFYKKLSFYLFSSALFIFLITRLLTEGMAKLQKMSPEVFSVLLVKGYSVVFMIIFFSQIINGFIMSLDRFYQSNELDLLLVSPVNRTSLFFSRLLETHLKTSWMLIIFGIPLLVSLGILFHANCIYYFYSLALFIIFSTIPVNAGIGSTILLSGVFHIKKIKKLLLSAGIITLAALITLFRIFRPERFVNPEFFANLKLFLIDLKTPSFVLFPNRWLSESLFNYLNDDFVNSLIFVALLILSSYLTVVALLLIYKKYHYKGWGLLQSGGIISKKEREHPSGIGNIPEKRIYARMAQKLLSLLGVQRLALLKKDILYQMRDIKNIHQHLILFSLIIVYLFSVSSLPLNWVEYAVKIKYFVLFFNLGLILIIIASLSSKLVYPAIISEGSFLWIIKASPITSRKYVMTKFILLIMPIFALGEALAIFSSFFIKVEGALTALIIFSTALLSFTLVSMSISFSISDLKSAVKKGDIEEIKTGNTAYMITAVFLTLLTLALEIIPVYLYFLKESEKIPFTQRTWLIIGVLASVLLLVNIFATAFSIHRSIRKFEAIQLD